MNNVVNTVFVLISSLHYLFCISVAVQARAIDRIFEILIVGAKPRHSGQAAGAKAVTAHVTSARRDVLQKHVTLPLFIENGEFPGFRRRKVSLR